MLESLLVLGQIPGTNIELTFFELVIAIYLPLLAVIWTGRHKFARMDRRYLQLIRLRRLAKLELAYLGIKPVESTRRIALTLPERTFQRQIWLPERQVRRAS